MLQTRISNEIDRNGALHKAVSSKCRSQDLSADFQCAGEGGTDDGVGCGQRGPLLSSACVWHGRGWGRVRGVGRQWTSPWLHRGTPVLQPQQQALKGSSTCGSSRGLCLAYRACHRACTACRCRCNRGGPLLRRVRLCRLRAAPHAAPVPPAICHTATRACQRRRTREGKRNGTRAEGQLGSHLEERKRATLPE